MLPNLLFFLILHSKHLATPYNYSAVYVLQVLNQLSEFYYTYAGLPQRKSLQTNIVRQSKSPLRSDAHLIKTAFNVLLKVKTLSLKYCFFRLLSDTFHFYITYILAYIFLYHNLFVPSQPHFPLPHSPLSHQSMTSPDAGNIQFACRTPKYQASWISVITLEQRNHENGYTYRNRNAMQKLLPETYSKLEAGERKLARNFSSRKTGIRRGRAGCVRVFGLENIQNKLWFSILLRIALLSRNYLRRLTINKSALN